jgi:sorbitol-specific phosphotransferase system component IIBC
MALKLTPKPAPAVGAEFDKHLATDKGKASTTVDTSHKGVQKTSTTTNETVKAGDSAPAPASQLLRIYVEGGQTINLGDYNSARITVGIEVPTTFKGVEAAYKWAEEFVSGKIEDTVKSINSGS